MRIQTLAWENMLRFFEFVKFALAFTKIYLTHPGDFGRLTRMPLYNFFEAAELHAFGGNQYILSSFSHLLHLYKMTYIPVSF